jgi:hypothetical protein
MRNAVFRNGRPISFGVGENFCPTLPYNCPPRPWEPDPGPRASIEDRLGTGAAPVEPPAPADVHPAVQAAVVGRPHAAHPAVQGAIRAAASGAMRAAATARPGAPPAQVHELARRGALSAVQREHGRVVGHPTVNAAIRAAARETAVARAWRPEWGSRPRGFGATEWRPEWGARPAWFGTRRWRGEWGPQPAWWEANLSVQQSVPDDGDDSQADASGSAPADSAAPTDSAAAAADAGPPADTKPGLSTLAKVGIGAAAVAVVGGTVAVLSSTKGKKGPRPSKTDAA